MKQLGKIVGLKRNSQDYIEFKIILRIPVQIVELNLWAD